MFKNYRYEKPAFIAKKSTNALTAAFAGGGWLHLNDPQILEKTPLKHGSNSKLIQ